LFLNVKSRGVWCEISDVSAVHTLSRPPPKKMGGAGGG
jgi:hypothetical protein